MDLIPSFISNKLDATLNATFLNGIGRKYVEKWVNNFWTDYNTHDPGITILELLAYAISDLGLRSRLEIQDYLQGGEAKPFFAAREILPNAAYTATDYRRLLIDQPYIRNVWLETIPSDIQGLYDLLLELEPYQEARATPQLDLNENWLRGEIIVPGTSSGTFHVYSFYVVLPHWEVLPEVWGINGVNLIEVELPDGQVRLPENPELSEHIAYFIEPTFTFSEGTQLIDVGMWVRLQPGLPKVNSPITEEDFSSRLVEELRNVNFYIPYQTRVRQRKTSLLETRRFILAHRNLCEDWEGISTIRIQQIGLQIAQLELEPEANPVEVVARIYFMIGQFIDPKIQSTSFEELLEQGKTASEIFEGPLLKNGFLMEENLNLVDRENKIYTSDLVHLIMKVPGVIGLKGLTLDHYLDRIKAASGVANCLNLRNPALYKPKFSIYDSAVKIFKRGNHLLDIGSTYLMPAGVNTINFVSPFLQVKNRWETLKESSPQIIVNGSGDLSVPEGNQLNIEDYYSIQNEFPRVYGLREGEITSDASPLRKAQAKQLKGYLLFFEQLLANYCSQLGNLQELFSSRNDAAHTYFFQAQYNVPAVKELYAAFLEENRARTSLSWDNFIHNCNSHIKRLDYATESRETFLQRRSMFIDHLLSRFAENFTEYAGWAYAKNGHQLGSDVLFDKLNFLRNYPQLSSQRAVAFQYGVSGEGGAIEVWDTENVSGYEKRVAAKLGIPNYQRRTLGALFNMDHYIEIYDEIDSVEDGVREGRFRFWNALVLEVYEGAAEGDRDVGLVDRSHFHILLSSTKRYVLDVGLENEIKKVVQFAQHPHYYVVAQTQPTRSRTCKYYLNLLDERMDQSDPIARRIDYPENRAEVEQQIQEIIHLTQGRAAEGMHLIEHVLLRPTSGSSVALRPVSFEVDSRPLTFIEDPYSFQVSIFLPGWAPRFQDPEFRVIVERTLREEMPANILPWIYWVELDETLAIPKDFLAFETTYRRWLENNPDEDRNELRDNLIEIINALVISDYVTLTNAYNPFSLAD